MVTTVSVSTAQRSAYRRTGAVTRPIRQGDSVNTQDAAKKAKTRIQAAARQRRLRAKRKEAGYPRREFNLSDEENTAVIAFIDQLRELI